MGQQGPYQVRGYGSASRHYFQKSISDLNLAQCSLLAAIVNSPGQYNPFFNPEKAKGRRSLVLQKMEEQKFITSNERQNAEEDSLPKNENADLYTTMPYFLQAAVEQTKKMGIQDLSGYKLFTTLDLRYQESAQAAIVNSLNQIESKNAKVKKIKETRKINLESALIAVDTATGSVRAVVGGRSFKKTQFNRILSSKRQAGSTFKPIVFLTALSTEDENMSPIFELKDENFTHHYGRQKWSPENYDHSQYGKVPLYFALKESLNLATAQLALAIGLEPVIEMARLLGIHSDLKPVPSLSLGAFELNPVELLQAYMTIARFGSYLEITFLDAVEDSEGNIIWAAENRHPESKVSSIATQILVGVLKHTIQTGTAKKIIQSGFDKIVAGKTGTTNDYRDSWFVGFTPDLLTIVWTGYDDNTSSGLTGASGSLPAWLSFMQEATKYDLIRDFPWTDEVNLRTIPIYDLKSNGFWNKKEVQEPSEVNLIFKK
jgi:penicillin-binding protein 1B